MKITLDQQKEWLIEASGQVGSLNVYFVVNKVDLGKLLASWNTACIFDENLPEPPADKFMKGVLF